MGSAEKLFLAYGLERGWTLSPNTVLVEGTSDQDFFQLARDLEKEESGVDLFSDGLSIVAAGIGDKGGVSGVVRELTVLRSLSEFILGPSGRPKYRFVGLVDHDYAGRLAVKSARSINAGMREYRDLFYLRPVMPTSGNLDPVTLGKSFERLNREFCNLTWETEDLLPVSFISAFLDENPSVCIDKNDVQGKVHWQFTKEGKSKLHRFVKSQAVYDDFSSAHDVIRSIRFVLNLPSR